MTGVQQETSTGAGLSCRLCGATLRTTFVDLGMSPPVQAFLTADQLEQGETFYPLDVRICDECLLVQLPAYIPAQDIFSEYVYFSSFSDSWLEHARRFVVGARERLGLGEDSFVVEVASNDGYLLRHVKDQGLRCLGVEPAANVARVAQEQGIDTEVAFLGEQTGTDIASRHGRADLVVANNVFGHVPDIVDFALGMRALLADDGTLSIEIPHLLRLIEGNEYDTIYHEHYQYVTLLTTQRILARAGMTVVDVEELPSHGGSLRTWSMPDAAAGEPSDAVAKVLADEERAGLHTLEGHAGFARSVARTRDEFVSFLVDCSRQGKRVAAYGASGKGNTLLNHAGVKRDQIEFAVDRNTHKQGLFLPGTHIPVHSPEKLAEERPDFILITPWNLRREIAEQLEYTREWGAQLVVPLPTLEIF